MSNDTVQRLTILGSTGSIGSSTLDVVARHRERFAIATLTAHRRIDRLFEQCGTFRPARAVVSDADDAVHLRTRLRAMGITTEVVHGPVALCEAAEAPDCDCVVAAIAGAAGLPASLAAARAGKKILLANKEALVMSGALFMQAVARSGATLLPLDSEHNAIFQCLAGGSATQDVDHLILTASGGPFLAHATHTLADVTPAQACAHPNWSMGQKISVDSATMMNKGLEAIEAHWLFAIPAERIRIVIHPQSIIHSMVAYVDGSVLAQLGCPDMRTPIAQALAHPTRFASGVTPLDFAQLEGLTFAAPDLQRFPCLKLALDVLHGGCVASIALNAANEVAVEAFLHRRIRFTEIAHVVDDTLQRIAAATPRNLEDILDVDGRSRAVACQTVHHLATPTHFSLAAP